MAHHLRFVGPCTIVLCALIVVAAAVTSRPNGVVQAGPPPTPTATATPSGEGDLAVDSSDSADPVQSGASFSYTATVENIGAGDVGEDIDPGTGQPVGVTVRNQVPNGFQVTSFIADFGGACILQAGGLVTCSFGVFAPADRATLTVTGSVTTPGDALVSNLTLADLPISETAETIEVANNIAIEDTTILAPQDSDGDTVPDKFETNTGIFVSPIDTGTDPNDPDTDDDGCADGEELGPDEELGGLRDPTYFWDFYDAPDLSGVRDASIDLFTDIFRVAHRFGANDAGATAPVNRFTDPLSAPPPDPAAYHPAFDRGTQLGPNPWSVTSADGQIDLFVDLFGVAVQFGHSCVAPP